MNQKLFLETYTEMMNRFSQMGAEVIFITPHFVYGTPADHDNRGYVANLKKFVADNKIALADASSRWAHLKKEGLPYITLLANNWNHPNDQGHQIFAEELIKCFDGINVTETIDKNSSNIAEK